MRYRIKIIIVICILTVFGLVTSIQAEQVGLMPIPVLQDVQVKAHVVFDTGTGLYTYSYSITNPATNTGEIWTIDIDISQPPNTLNLSSAGLTIPFGVNTLAFDEVLAMRRNPAPMIPVGMQMPSGWDGGVGPTGLADFTSGDPRRVQTK